MLFTPFVIQYSEKISAILIHPRIQKKWGVLRSKYDTNENEDVKGLENHLVIIGYGINGTNVAKAARYAKIPYVILELNADVVRLQRARGEPIVFGDAVHEHILNTVRLKNARVVVIAISDPKATNLIVSNIRNISQSVYVVVRTRYVKEIDTLIELGADEVIPEEFETSIEIFTRVLHNYLVPIDEMQNLIDSIRADNYNLFLPQGRSPKNIASTRIPDFKISCIRLLADSGSIIGKTIAEANVRKKFGVNILAISRKDKMINTIKPNEKMIQNDLVFITGDQEHIESFYNAVS
jgi:CPA2 family monovalent cation:H+ antiporter-2